MSKGDNQRPRFITREDYEKRWDKCLPTKDKDDYVEEENSVLSNNMLIWSGSWNTDGDTLELLRPCPFCGGDALIRDEPNTWYIECEVCPCCMKGDRDGLNPEHDELEILIKAWNVRV